MTRNFAMHTSLWRIIGIFTVLCIFATAQTHTPPGPAGPGSGQPYLTTASDGRVDALLLKDGGAIVSWLVKLDGGGAVRVRRIHPNGKLDPSIVVAPAGTARSSGFPQMALAGDALLFAWTADRVMTTSVPLAALMPPNDH